MTERNAWRGVTPRRQVAQQARIYNDISSLLPLVAATVVPIIGNLPMLLAVSAPRQLLSRHYYNAYEVLEFNEMAFRHRERYFGDTKRFLQKSISSLDELNRSNLQHLAMTLGFGQHWPTETADHVIRYLPQLLLVRFIRQQLDALALDDMLLIREGAHIHLDSSLTDLEVMDACLARCLPISKASSVEELRTELKEYLKAVQGLRKSEGETVGLKCLHQALQEPCDALAL